MRLILASGSPRRHELLKKAGFAFEVRVPEVDEHVPGPAREAVGILAERKARKVASELAGEKDAGRCLIVAADTLVSLEGRALGKPVSRKEAREMLQSLSGREHEVFTGLCLIHMGNGQCAGKVVRTGVRFRELSSEEIDRYVSTGEPMDKAGAYAIQGGANGFVESLDGEFDNVMGFPVREFQELYDALREESESAE